MIRDRAAPTHRARHRLRRPKRYISLSFRSSPALATKVACTALNATPPTSRVSTRHCDAGGDHASRNSASPPGLEPIEDKHQRGGLPQWLWASCWVSRAPRRMVPVVERAHPDFGGRRERGAGNERKGQCTRTSVFHQNKFREVSPNLARGYHLGKP